MLGGGGIVSWVDRNLRIGINICRYWTLIKIKIGMTCVRKEYERKMKIVQKQWMQLKMKLVLAYNIKMVIQWGLTLEVYFEAFWDKPLKVSRKKISLIPMYTHFWQFLTIFDYKKSTIGINTYTLTLNKKNIFMCTYFLIIFNHKKAP